MNCYIDIHLKPDAELKEADLSAKVYAKFHKALVTLNTNKIAISFPKVKHKLGLLYRLHGSETLLNDLQKLNWIGPLQGYCKISDITPIPKQVSYRIISVKRSNMSKAKLNRLIERGTIDKTGEKRYKIKMLSQGFDNPYLDLLSSSSGEVYRKFFEFSDIVNSPVDGMFDTYGLSKTATVPWF